MCDNFLLQQELYDAAKNWLAMDGLWFQGIEQSYGMNAALEMDKKVWEQFSVIEAERIKKRLSLPERGGLDALEIALNNRLYHLLNDQEIRRPDTTTLFFTMKTCRVQAARERKGMQLFPCKTIGLGEYSVFAKTIDPRIKTECVSCPPQPVQKMRYCAWKFVLGTPDTDNYGPGH